MKKLVLVLVLCVVAAGISMAGGLDFHLGAGYHSSYFSAKVEAPEDIKALPIGVGGYAGIGFGLGQSGLLNLGVEFAPSWDLAVPSFKTSNFSYQARAYVKVKPMDILTVTGFGGYSGNQYFGADWNAWEKSASWAVGARVTALFLYAEYAAILNSSYDGITKSEIGVGFAFFK